MKKAGVEAPALPVAPDVRLARVKAWEKQAREDGCHQLEEDIGSWADQETLRGLTVEEFATMEAGWTEKLPHPTAKPKRAAPKAAASGPSAAV